jgi:hypothetical protein
MGIHREPAKWLSKKTKIGFRGYPVGVIEYDGGEAAHLRRWLSDTADVRGSETILGEVVDFLRTHEVRSVTMIDGIFGCPHEEGIDYPDGETCPQCPYWAEHDRFAGRGQEQDRAAKARAIAALAAGKYGR